MTSRTSPPEYARIEPTHRADTDLLKHAHAVVHEGQSLMVWRPAMVLLQGLAESLQSHWQSRIPEVLIAHFSGRQPALLLGKINEQLSQQHLQSANASGPNPLPEAIWFVHDAECLATDELLLLLRLNAHFPGWKNRWVLLFNASATLAQDKQDLLSPSRAHWLKWQLDGAAHRSALAEVPHPATPPVSQAVALAPKPLIPALALTSQPNKAWLIGVLAVLGVGTALVQMRPREADKARPVVAQTESAPSSLAAPTHTATHTATHALGASSAQETAPASVAPAPQAVAPSESRSREPVAQAPASPALPIPAPPPTREFATQDPSALPAAARPPGHTPPEATMPDVAMRGHRWLSKLPEDSFLLEHGVFESAQQAQRLIKAQAELNNARIVMLKPAAGMASRYVVITGPFRSLERAQNFKARQQLPHQIKIEESARVLQQSLKPPPHRESGKP